MITNYELILPEGYVPPPLPFRDKWCAELQSGMHKQIANRLYDERGQCCLGVLCEIENLPCNIEDLTNTKNVRSYYGSSSTITSSSPLYEYLNTNGDFPQGIRVDYGWGGYRNINASSLVVLNDSGFTFDQIARIIKRVWSQPQY